MLCANIYVPAPLIRLTMFTRPSSFWMIFFPPFMAICSASSSLPLMSFIWSSRLFLTRSRCMMCSCSTRSSSSTRAVCRPAAQRHTQHHQAVLSALCVCVCVSVPHMQISWPCRWLLWVQSAAPRAPASAAERPLPASASRWTHSGTESTQQLCSLQTADSSTLAAWQKKKKDKSVCLVLLEFFFKKLLIFRFFFLYIYIYIYILFSF